MATDPSALLRRAGLAPGPQVRLAGGDVSEVWRVSGVIAKSHSGAPPGMFAAEARGLRELQTAGVRVPTVHHVDEDGIVMEDLGEGRQDWRGLARQLATLHTTPVADYGVDAPAYIATLPLPSGRSLDWPTLYWDQRISPLLDETVADPVRRWFDRRPPLVLEGPRLLHGDLWRGNVVFGTDGPGLVDPSAQRGERGLDLAMMRLFGGFPDAFWDAYVDAAPLPDAVVADLPVYRLYFLLVHLQLFGGAYRDAVLHHVKDGRPAP